MRRKSELRGAGLTPEATNETVCPCLNCDRPACQAGPKIAREFQKSEYLANAENPNHRWHWPNRLIDASLNGLAELYRKNDAPSPSPQTALPAIFDLVVNALYAARVSDSGWVYCLGPSGNYTPAQYYSFVGVCPRCALKRHYFPAKAHKPESANIGDDTEASIMLILDKLIKHNNADYKLASTNNRQGDIDLFAFGNNLLAMGEIKASPLISYPLEIILSKPLTTESGENEIVPRSNHELDSPRIVDEARSISLYIPQSDYRINLGQKSDHGWPFEALAEFVQNPEAIQIIIDSWNIAYQAYSHKNRNAPVFYLSHGCGGKSKIKISDSKNAPGIDRTDDIKKGTYQLLKYGAYYAEKCERRLVRSILVGNMHAVIHQQQYVTELEDVIWTKESLKHSEEKETVTWQRKDLFNLYDGIICLSKVTTHDPILEQLFNLDTFAHNLISNQLGG